MAYSSLFKLISRRLCFGLIFWCCIVGLGLALYAQYYQGAEPCPLCIAQRVIFAGVALISGIALVHNPQRWGGSLYSLIILGVAAFGAKIAYHHVWLQSLPMSEWPASCGMPLEVLYKKIPLSGFLHLVLAGSAECASVEWKIFGLSAPGISLWSFILIAALSVYSLGYRKSKRNRYD